MNTPTSPHTNNAAFLLFPAVCSLFGLTPGRAARTFLWRNARNGRMPAPVKLGPSRIAWRTADIEAFIASRQPVTYAASTEAR